MTQRTCLARLVVVTVVVIGSLSPARADIYKWEYINPADSSQGKRQSKTLAIHGAGIDAIPGASFYGLDLEMAYLTGADLSGAYGHYANLTNADLSKANLTNADFYEGAILTGADFTGAEVRGASFGASHGSGITLAQLYSTASFQAHDLTGIQLQFNDLTEGAFAGQRLANANLGAATLTDAIFRDANLTHAVFVAYVCGIDDCFPSYATLIGADFSRANLFNAHFGSSNLTGANLRQANLTNATFFTCAHLFGGCLPIHAALTDADLTEADARGAGLTESWLSFSSATTTNLIRPNGRIDGLDLDAAGRLIVRDYDGYAGGYDANIGDYRNPIPPIAITVAQRLQMSAGGALRMVFEADAWDSTISFAPGIPVTLGGTLELTFAADVELASQIGRTFQLFDWTDVAPLGAFSVSSPYRWNLANLYTTGEVTLTSVPEPTTIALTAAGAVGAVHCRRRRIP
jgi:uncharacterized protein YjbI with pentapeptide repeats